MCLVLMVLAGFGVWAIAYGPLDTAAGDRVSHDDAIRLMEPWGQIEERNP